MATVKTFGINFPPQYFCWFGEMRKCVPNKRAIKYEPGTSKANTGPRAKKTSQALV